VTELKTKESLLSALRQAAAQTPTPEELHRQRVSFIMGALKHTSDVTRARVEEVLAQQEGRKVA
jgi:hypothetical protein